MIGEPLFDADAIAQRVSELGATISRDYAGKVPLLVGMLTAAATILGRPVACRLIPCEIDVISVNRYGDGDGIAFQKDTSRFQSRAAT